MSEAILGIRGWVHCALKSLQEDAMDQLHNKRRMTDYERGRVSGGIAAYQHVLVKTSPFYAWKNPMYAFDAWVTDVSSSTPLTMGASMEIYNFCEENNLLDTPNLIDRVIGYGLRGYSRYDITNLLMIDLNSTPKWRRKK